MATEIARSSSAGNSPKMAATSKPALPGLRRNNTAEPKLSSTGNARSSRSSRANRASQSPKMTAKPALPGLRRNNTAEPKLRASTTTTNTATAGPPVVPALRRNNSIDPRDLGASSGGGGATRRVRRPNPAILHDSGLTCSTTGSNETMSSFASRWSCGGESVKFSVKNFVNQRSGTLESYYDIGELIGEGGFGEVYSCYHVDSGEERAVKVMEKSIKKPVVNEEIIKEYNILKELDHPNILKVYEMYETKSHFFIVTDLYSGGDLFSELEDNGCFNEAEAAQVMNAMLMCMNYCHKRNLVHLDLKPENVLLTDNKVYSDVKLIDFGLAQYQVQSEKMTGLEGSSYYMSPQVVKRSYIGSKADVWSCGVICHVIMTGYAPFDGPTYKDILKAITVGEFDFDDPEWDGVSDECKSFIRYCLTYDEDERPSAEEALEHPYLKKVRNHSARSDRRRRASTRQSLKQLEQFSSRHSKLKQATCAIMASQLLTQEEKDSIDDVFRNLDTTCDGQLHKEDLKRGYKEYFDTELTDKEVDNLFEQVNFSGSGSIEYSEFTIAILMAKDKVDDQKLKAAFRLYDEDGKGYISGDDIKRVLQLGDDQEDYLKKKILRQVDAEDTGRIDFDKFKTIMYSTTPLEKKKKKKTLTLKRSPRRALVTSPLATLDIKNFQGANLTDCSLMDASELSAASGIGSPFPNHQRRAFGVGTADTFLQDLDENDDEDNTSEREARRGPGLLADESQSSYDEDM